MKKLLVVAFVLFGTSALAEETVTQKVTNWFQNEWIKTVEFQKESWAQGKEQLNNNKLYIQDLFNKVKTNVSQN